MTRHIEIVGTAGNDEVQNHILNQLNLRRDEIRVVEPNAEEKYCIEVGCYYINNYWKNFCNSKEDVISSENFSIFYGQSNDLISDSVEGTYFPSSDHIYLRRKRPSLSVIDTIIHEGCHFVSFNKIRIKTPEIYQVRSGYQFVKSNDNEDISRLKGFNEGIVEKITYEILSDFSEEVISSLGINIRSFKRFIENKGFSISCYSDNIKIVNTIINRLAKSKSHTYEQVWDEIRKGFFTGRVMHLRDIEEVFGRGSLKILMAFQSGGTAKNNFWINNRILKYFSTTDQQKRIKIAHKILNSNYREQFDKRQIS